MMRGLVRGTTSRARAVLVAGVATFLACGCGAPVARARSAPVASPAPSTLTGGFSPNKLGAPSTIELGFQLHRPGGAVPPPLLGVEFLLPAGVSLTTSELGLDICNQTTVANVGLGGCLPDSVMGYGSAMIVAPTAVEGIFEPAGVTVLQAPPESRHTTLLFYVNGSSPVIAQLVFSGEMLDAPEPFGANLDTTIPLTPGLPGEQDVSVVRMRATIGPKGVTYYKDVHGTRVPYTPKGVVIPSRCPAGGFPFKATFLFAGGGQESASTTSPCPSRGDSAPRRGRR
jgi:hypothetical protein